MEVIISNQDGTAGSTDRLSLNLSEDIAFAQHSEKKIDQIVKGKLVTSKGKQTPRKWNQWKFEIQNKKIWFKERNAKFHREIIDHKKEKLP